LKRPDEGRTNGRLRGISIRTQVKPAEWSF
jgi:hypothetical protein